MKTNNTRIKKVITTKQTSEGLITNEELYDYDKNNNCIHRKNSNGEKCWYEYDENNNLIHRKNSNGNEYWLEYDENNNCIHRKNYNGTEQWY